MITYRIRHIYYLCVLILTSLSVKAQESLRPSSPSECGFSSTLESTIDSIVDLCIQSRAFPGCQILIAKDGNIAIDKAYGTLDYGVESKKVTHTTLYDIASMTKAVATVAGLMAAYDDGLFQLDDTVATLLPRLTAEDKSDLTVKDFLFHETGMPAVINTYSVMVDTASFEGPLMKSRYESPYTVKLDKNVYGNNTATLRSDIIQKNPSDSFYIEFAKGLYGSDEMVRLMSDTIYNVSPREKRYLYSCLNFCILKDLEEALTCIPHQNWLDNRVYKPIGARNTMFRPSDNDAVMGNIAPTENDMFMRKQVLCGYVHDEMAAYLGGVSGNAGLFSTAGDVARLCQTWLDGGVYNGIRVFGVDTVKLFTETVSQSSGRGLGFDKPGCTKAMRETGMPEAAYGHTGFTGTCFWADPVNNIIIVILTNRVYPSRDNASWNRLRPRTAICKAVYDSLAN